jgi:TolA-binding protein
VGDDAKTKLAALMGKPEVKKAMESAEREGQASTALEGAKKLSDAKQHEAAYPKLKTVAATFPGTPSGDEAAAMVKAYESDAAFMKGLTEKESGGKAKAALSIARSYVTANRKDAARKKYKEIIQAYAGTEYAKTAQAELDKLK